MENDAIDRLAKMLAEELPQGLRSMRDDLEKNFRSVLKSGLEKLDLVTREEFEVQEAVLQRTREKLEALLKRLEQMEAAAPVTRTRSTVKKPAGRKAKKKSQSKAGRKGKKKRSAR